VDSQKEANWVGCKLRTELQSEEKLAAWEHLRRRYCNVCSTLRQSEEEMTRAHESLQGIRKATFPADGLSPLVT
jgi:hypothetical protein